jgi:DNA gyrase/topoisomerase IV subunit A
VSSDEPSREQQEARVAILDAYLLAAGRRQEVFDIAAESESPHDARHALAQLLDVSEDAASAVLELRLLRFTKTEQTTLRVERDSIRGRLDRGL